MKTPRSLQLTFFCLLKTGHDYEKEATNTPNNDYFCLCYNVLEIDREVLYLDEPSE